MSTTTAQHPAPPPPDPAEVSRLAAKLPVRTLMLLAALHDRQGVFRGETLGAVSHALVELDGTVTPIAMLQGNPNRASFQTLISEGLLSKLRTDRIEARLKEATGGHYGAHYSTQYHGVNALGRAVRQEASERIDIERARLAGIDDTPCYLATKPIQGGFSQKRLPGVASLLQILAETPKGYRVIAVGEAGKRGPFLVSRDDVAVVGITPDQFAAMREATLDYQGRLSAAQAATKAEIESIVAPIQRRLVERETQLLAMLEDGMREIREGSPEAAPEGPKPR